MDHEHRDSLRWLNVGIIRLSALAVATNVLISVHSPYLTSAWTPTWLTALVGVLLALPSLAIIWTAWVGEPDFRPVRAFVIASVAANLLIAVGPHHASPPPGTTFLNSSTTVANCVAVFAWPSARRALTWMGAVTVSFAGALIPGVGTTAALLQAPVSMLGSTILGLLARAVAASYQAAEDSEEQRRALAVRAAAQEERRRARERWDRLLHDKVLGALTLASRAVTPQGRDAARLLAGDALDALGVLEKPGDHGGAARNEDEIPGSSLSGREDPNHGFGLEVIREGKFPLGVPADVKLALESASSEALLNVAKHAGVATALVSVIGDARAVTVTVTDTGRGFERDEASADVTHGFGLGHSLPGHLAGIGATYAITSAPGER